MSEFTSLAEVLENCQRRSAALGSFTIELHEAWDYEPAKYSCTHTYVISGNSYVHIRDSQGVQQQIGLKAAGKRWVSIIRNKKGAFVTKNLPPYDNGEHLNKLPKPEMPGAVDQYEGQSVGDLIRNPTYFPLTLPAYQQKRLALTKAESSNQSHWTGQFKTRTQLATLSLKYSPSDPGLMVETKVDITRRRDDSFASSVTWVVTDDMVANDGSLVPKRVKRIHDSGGQNPPDTTWALNFQSIQIGVADDAAFEIDTYVAGEQNVTYSDWQEFEASQNDSTN